MSGDSTRPVQACAVREAWIPAPRIGGVPRRTGSRSVRELSNTARRRVVGMVGRRACDRTPSAAQPSVVLRARQVRLGMSQLRPGGRRRSAARPVGGGRPRHPRPPSRSDRRRGRWTARAWPSIDGCLFTVTGGDTPNPDDGYAVTNADGVPLWDFTRANGTSRSIGYPISQRWVNGPFTLQAFQKVILQWDHGQAPA